MINNNVVAVEKESIDVDAIFDIFFCDFPLKTITLVVHC